MRQRAVNAALGLAVAVGVLTAACAPPPAPAEPTPGTALGTPLPRPGGATPAVAIGTPTPRLATPVPVVATPTAGVATSTPAATVSPVVAATPSATPTPGTMAAATPTALVRGVRATPGATDPHDVMMSDMEELGDRLDIWASGMPTANDLMDMVDTAALLMDDMHRFIDRMTPQEREQALGKTSDIMGQMAQVMRTHVHNMSTPWGADFTLNTPGPMGALPDTAMGRDPATPEPMMPDGMMGGTPAAGATDTQQMAAKIDQMRDRMVRLWNGQPTDQEIIDLLGEMQGVLGTMQQRAGSIPTEDMETLWGDMTQAMDNLVRVMEVHIAQETRALVPDAPTRP